MNNSGNIFSSNYSTSNPFNMNGMGNMSSSLDNSLMESYAKLEALKQKQAELANLSQQKPDAQVRRQVLDIILNGRLSILLEAVERYGEMAK